MDLGSYPDTITTVRKALLLKLDSVSPVGFRSNSDIAQTNDSTSPCFAFPRPLLSTLFFFF